MYGLSPIGQWRRKIAGKFGRTEHTISRILGICLACNLYYYRDILALSLMIIWLLYWGSHICEKKIYGRFSYK